MTTSKAAVPAMFTNDVASGIPQMPSGANAMSRIALRKRLPSATAVGTQLSCRLKNERFSISIVPLNVRPRQSAARQDATAAVWVP